MFRRALILLCLIAAAAAAVGQQPGVPQDILASRITIPLSQPPQRVASGSAQVKGNPGNSTYYYWVVSNYGIGNSSPAGPFIAFNAPATVSSTDQIQVSWASAAGATSYDLLRTTTPIPPAGACNCAVTTGITGTSSTDQGTALSAYTIASFDPSAAKVTLENIADSLGHRLAIKFGGTEEASLSDAGQWQSKVIGSLRYVNLFSGADLGTKLTAAIADLPSSGGTVVITDAGTIVTPVIITTSHVAIVCTGANGANIITNGVATNPAPAAITDTASDFSITGCQMQGSSTSGNNIAIIGTSASAGTGRVYLTDVTSVDATGAHAEDYSGTAMNAAGLYVHNIATELVVLGGSFSYNHTGIVLDNSGSPATDVNSASIHNSTIEQNAADGVDILGAQSHAITFNANDIELNAGWGINQYGCFSCVYSGNYLESNSSGGVNNTAFSSGLSIVGNWFSQNVSQGPELNLASSGNAVAALDVRGNEFFADGTGTYAAAAILQGTGSFSDNTITASYSNASTVVTDFLSLLSGSQISVLNNKVDAGSTGTVANVVNNTYLAQTQGASFTYGPGNGDIVGDNGDGSAYERLAIEPFAGKQGWLQFSEQNVADRWTLGIKPGDGTFYGLVGSPASNAFGFSFDSSGDLTLKGYAAIDYDGANYFELYGSPTAVRYVRLPDAASNTVQPLASSTASEWVSYVDGAGVQHLSQPSAADLTNGAKGSGQVVLASNLPLVATLAWSPGAIAAGACTTTTQAVASATTSMAAAVSPAADPGAGLAWEAWVSAAGTVSVRLCNTTASPVTPTAENYNIRVIQ